MKPELEISLKIERGNRNSPDDESSIQEKNYKASLTHLFVCKSIFYSTLSLSVLFWCVIIAKALH
jgi:hypothetical protein